MPDGRPALLHLFEHLAPDVIAEVDIYWAQVGGSDPAALVAELGERRRPAAREGRTGRRPREPDGRGRRRCDRRARRARGGADGAAGTSSSSTAATPTCSTRSSAATTTSSAASCSRGSVVSRRRDRRVRRDQPHVRAHDLAARVRRARGVRRRRSRTAPRSCAAQFGARPRPLDDGARTIPTSTRS